MPLSFGFTLAVAFLFLTVVAVVVRRLWHRKKEGYEPRVVREVPLRGIDDGASPLLRVFDDGVTYLLTEWFPWENCRITEEMLTDELSGYVGVDVLREDRDRFVIMSGDDQVLDKIVKFLQERR